MVRHKWKWPAGEETNGFRLAAFGLPFSARGRCRVRCDASRQHRSSTATPFARRILYSNQRKRGIKLKILKGLQKQWKTWSGWKYFSWKHKNTHFFLKKCVELMKLKENLIFIVANRLPITLSLSTLLTFLLQLIGITQQISRRCVDSCEWRRFNSSWPFSIVS